MIQFFSVTTLYLEGSNLSDNQFLYIDIGVLVPLCIFQSWTGAYHKLTPVLPQESLFSPSVLISVLGSAAIQFTFQFYLFWNIKEQVGPTYSVCKTKVNILDDDSPCTLNTMIYIFTCLQYIITCLCFSISKPFRKPVWTNPLYLVSVLLMLAYGVYLLFHFDSWS
jgi:cation-transporting ATPase 13A2